MKIWSKILIKRKVNAAFSCQLTPKNLSKKKEKTLKKTKCTLSFFAIFSNINKLVTFNNIHEYMKSTFVRNFL